MATNKRVIWTKAELGRVAAGVYRQFKFDAEMNGSKEPKLRRVNVKDVEIAQSIALEDRARHKAEITPSVLVAVSGFLEQIVEANQIPRGAVSKPRQAEEVILRAQTTIDMQIRSLVRSELVGYQPALLGRIEELLRGHEHRIAALIQASENRLTEFWGSPTPHSHTPEPTSKLEAQRVRKARVLVACLRSDQHRLIRDRLVDIADQVDVVVLSQDDAFVGVRNEYYDKVVVLTKFVGHSHFAKVQSLFSKDKILLCNGAALSAAATIRGFLEELSVSTPNQFRSSQ